jgi:hypothetical protein
MDNKKYIVKRFAENPFSRDLKDALILCDTDTLEPYCDIDFGERLVKEGDVLDNTQFETRLLSKRIKHVVVGDNVFMRNRDRAWDRCYVGTVESVTFDEDDFYLKSMAKVKDIRLSGQGKFFKKPKPTIKERVFCLNDISIVEWLSATITIKCPHCGR